MSPLSETAIVSRLAGVVVERLVARVIRDFQHDAILSDRDVYHSMLQNGWDELCVVVHHDGIACGDRYEDAIQIATRRFVEKLEQFELEAVWLQTEEGFDWDCEEPDAREPYPVDADGVVNYIAAMVVEKAGDWSNDRIRKCIEYRYETG